jgi:hypothetical protein
MCSSCCVVLLWSWLSSLFVVVFVVRGRARLRFSLSFCTEVSLLPLPLVLVPSSVDQSIRCRTDDCWDVEMTFGWGDVGLGCGVWMWGCVVSALALLQPSPTPPRAR